ncbi:MAG: type II toxin-antitoxin system HicA family toxin [Patescibacteria group bacterium]
MAKLPALRSGEVMSVLRKAGFYISHRKGDHVKLRNQLGHTTVVPAHNRNIKRELLKRIIKDSELSEEGFLQSR